MAENGRDNFEQLKTTVDKDIRLRSLKDRQNEERQKKLEEIKAQALAAQRFKEQKEHERRRRLDELKGKEDVRRQQVEERKKAIYQAEQDRLVSILRRNQEREARIESKKRNERSNIVFAFGSSTPRMLDPTDMMTSSFWGHRRATSIQNITCSTSSLTRRQSERDLDSGSKKRATSAGGLERSIGEDSTPLTPAGCVSGYVGRRRTDLMPTIPSRDASFSASRKSLNHSPGRAYSMTRLDQLAKPRSNTMKRPPPLLDLSPLRKATTKASTTTFSSRSLSSSPRQSSVTRSMSHLAVVNRPAGLMPSSPSHPPSYQQQLQQQQQQQIYRKPLLNKSDSRSMHQLTNIDGALLLPRTTRATQLRQQKLLTISNNYCSEASSRPSSSLSQQSTTSVTSSVSVRHRPSTTSTRRQRPASIAITGVTHDLGKNPIGPTSADLISNKKSDLKPPLPKTSRKSINNSNNNNNNNNMNSNSSNNINNNNYNINNNKSSALLVGSKNINKISSPVDNNNTPKNIIASPVSTSTTNSIILDINNVVDNDLAKATKLIDNVLPIRTTTNELINNIEEEQEQNNSSIITTTMQSIPDSTDLLLLMQDDKKSYVADNSQRQSEVVDHSIYDTNIDEKMKCLNEKIESTDNLILMLPQQQQTEQILPTNFTIDNNNIEEPSNDEIDIISQKTKDLLIIDYDNIKSTNNNQSSQDFINAERTKSSSYVINNDDKDSDNNLNNQLINNITTTSTTIILDSNNKENEMTSSITKSRINTEEEAKAALAERRRLAREEAERLAEQERLRIELEIQAEFERQKREEEQVQLLVEQQRAAEQERLEEAIKETQKREEEEKLRQEEEQRLKVLKEEAEKRAREEAERQKAELQERLKNEEKERVARRKRVEAIMLRTRGKNNANNATLQQGEFQQNPDEDKNENKSENKINGAKPITEQENLSKNSKVLDIVDNIKIPDETVKNANNATTTVSSMDTINNSTDSINSNNTWQTTQQQQQYGQLM